MPQASGITTTSHAPKTAAVDDCFVFSCISACFLSQIHTKLVFWKPVFTRNRANQKIGDKSSYQYSRHNVQYSLICSGFVDSVLQLVFAHVVHERRSSDTSS